MRNYAVFLDMLDEEKSKKYRPQHIEFLAEGRKSGTVLTYGKFTDGTGGLVIYKATSYEEAEQLVKQDPFVVEGARTYSIHEWEMVTDVLDEKKDK